jgi:ribosomal-protein-alanine N-acetyltransferase
MASSIDIETDHLILRLMPPGAAAALPGDRDAAVTLIGASLDPEWPLPDILDLMPMHAPRSMPEASFGIWLIIEAAMNAVIGDIGFFGPPDAAGEMELGYSVVPSRRRRGYATEAAAGIVAWAFDQPGVTTIVAGTEPANDVSQRVLERVGFERTTASPVEIRWRRTRAAHHE